MILQIVNKLNKKKEKKKEREREREYGGGWMVGCDEKVDDPGWSV